MFVQDGSNNISLLFCLPHVVFEMIRSYFGPNITENHEKLPNPLINKMKAISFLFCFPIGTHALQMKGGKHKSLRKEIPIDVQCESTEGDFTIRLQPELSPSGVNRFLDLVENGFFNDKLLYRILPGFIMQFGAGENTKEWRDKRIPDEPNKEAFRKGTVAFAGSGDNSRSSDVFVSFSDNDNGLGTRPWETAIGEVVEKDFLDKVQEKHKESKYGDLSNLYQPLTEQGNTAASNYPQLPKINKCSQVQD